MEMTDQTLEMWYARACNLVEYVKNKENPVDRRGKAFKLYASMMVRVFTEVNKPCSSNMLSDFAKSVEGEARSSIDKYLVRVHPEETIIQPRK